MQCMYASRQGIAKVVFMRGPVSAGNRHSKGGHQGTRQGKTHEQWWAQAQPQQDASTVYQYKKSGREEISTNGRQNKYILESVSEW